jgi:hypothetical protein
LQDLNGAHLDRLYAELLSNGRISGDGGLSPTSVRRIHAMLRKAMRDAARWGRVKRDATEFADPPPPMSPAARWRSPHRLACPSRPTVRAERVSLWS